jgi:uncharacterized protein (DUF2235 family)
MRTRGKNIVICSDGTGNSAIKGRGTNVFKVFEAVDTHGHRRDPGLVPQVTYYDDGVGTENLKYVRALAGATGWGLSRNVKQLYLQLVRVFEPGDRIFLFGFSRGAFTVRTLAGFITSCGILDVAHPDFHSDADLRRAVKRAYGEYRQKYRTRLAEWLLPSRSTARAFCKAHRIVDPVFVPEGRVPIHFIGVWDTVDAVGLPTRLADLLNEVVWRFKFKDRKLSPLVQRACHALALDDERQSFAPVLWDEREEPDGRIEQVWFAGAHSNVGGGYPRQGMSLVALDWMMERAEEAGLRFVEDERAYYREHRNVDDKLYDPRAGMGVFYRWKPRDVLRLCADHGVPPRIHVSAFERIARGTEDYAPGNIPPTAEIVATVAATVDLDAIRGVLRPADGASGRGSVHARLTSWLWLGSLSYYVFVGTLTAVALGALAAMTRERGGGVAAGVGLVTEGTAVVWELPRVILSSLPMSATLALGLALAWLLEVVADARVSRACSEFWHARQPRLLAPLRLQGVEERPGEGPPAAA